MFGLVLLVGYVLNFVLVFVVLKQTLSWGYLFGLLIPAIFITTPLLNKRSLRNLYARSTSLHGKLCLSADEGGIELKGSSFQSKVDWSVFDSFFEDKDSFVLFQKTQVINIVPKRALNPDDIRELNKLFQMKIKRS